VAKTLGLGGITKDFAIFSIFAVFATFEHLLWGVDHNFALYIKQNLYGANRTDPKMRFLNFFKNAKNEFFEKK